VGEGRCGSSDRGDVGFGGGCILSDVGLVGLMLPANGFSEKFGGRLGYILVYHRES
jgi:hypothetical protein